MATNTMAGNSTMILVIEDDETLRYAIKIGLERSSEFQVVTASDGESGLEILRSNTPDVLLLDILLPDIDGFEILRQLSPTGDLKRPDRVIAMSAFTDIETRARLDELDIDTLMPKPFTLDELRNTLAAAYSQ